MKLKTIVILLYVALFAFACAEDSITETEETKNSFSQYSVADTFKISMEVINGSRTQSFDIPTEHNMKYLRIKITDFKKGICTLKVYNNQKVFYTKNMGSNVNHIEFLSLQPTRFVLEYQDYSAQGNLVFTWF